MHFLVLFSICHIWTGIFHRIFTMYVFTINTIYLLCRLWNFKVRQNCSEHKYMCSTFQLSFKRMQKQRIEHRYIIKILKRTIGNHCYLFIYMSIHVQLCIYFYTLLSLIICDIFFLFTLLFVFSHVGHDFTIALLYLSFFLYICALVFLLKYWYFYYIFQIFLQFNTSAVFVNIISYYPKFSYFWQTLIPPS